MEYFRFKIFKLMANGKKYLLCFNIFHVSLFFLKSLFIFSSLWVDGISTIVICWLSWLGRGKKTSTLGNPTSTFQYQPHIQNNPHMKPNISVASYAQPWGGQIFCKFCCVCGGGGRKNAHFPLLSSSCGWENLGGKTNFPIFAWGDQP